MKNWFRNLLLERIYLKSIKASNKKVIKYGEKIKTISVILDNRLGIDKDSFKIWQSHLIYRKKMLEF